MPKQILLILWIILLLTQAVYASQAISLDINGVIGPATQDYIKRNLENAEKQKSTIIILHLNSPGGLKASVKELNQLILSSSIPVIAYVSPTGSVLADNGLSLLYTSNFSAMANQTNLSATAIPTNPQQNVNSYIDEIKNVANIRNHNAAWLNNPPANLSAKEALSMHVIDFIADTDKELLAKVNNHQTTLNDAKQTVHTNNITLENKPIDWRFTIVNFLTHPIIFYILLLIAIYSLFYELANPGLVIPGFIGVLALLIILFVLQLIPINFAGLTLLLIGIGFMIAELFYSTNSLLGLGGLVAFVLGSVWIFDMHDKQYHLSLGIIFAMSLITATYFFIIATLVLRAHKTQQLADFQKLLGQEGTVISVMNEQVIVRVNGEIWSAESPKMVDQGQLIKVTGVDGLTLVVTPINK